MTIAPELHNQISITVDLDKNLKHLSHRPNKAKIQNYLLLIMDTITLKIARKIHQAITDLSCILREATNFRVSEDIPTKLHK